MVFILSSSTQQHNIIHFTSSTAPTIAAKKKICKQLQKLCYWRNNHSTTAPLKRESSVITEGSHLNKAPGNRYSLLKRKVAR